MVFNFTNLKPEVFDNFKSETFIYLYLLNNQQKNENTIIYFLENGFGHLLYKM
jgi:hypothetical protein